MSDQSTTRRDLLKKLAAGTIAAGPLLSLSSFAGDDMEETHAFKGNIHHSVCAWTFNFLGLENLCKLAKKLGLKAIDLVAPKDWPLLQQYGLECSMCYTAGKISLTEGWNHTEYHEQLIKDFTEAIPLVPAVW